MQFEVTTKIVDSGKILQEVTSDCGLSERGRTKLFSQVIDTQDQGIQDALKQLGWTKADDDFRWQPYSTVPDSSDDIVVIAITEKDLPEFSTSTQPYVVRGNTLVGWPYSFKPTHWWPIPGKDRK